MMTILKPCRGGFAPKTAAGRLRIEAVEFLRRCFSLAEGAKPCLRCGRFVYGIPFCPGCTEKYLHVPFSCAGRCVLCGRELLSEKDLCMQCRNTPVMRHVDRAFPLFPYVFWYRDLLHAWKTAGERSLGTVFADAAARCVKNCFPRNGDGSLLPLVPVPPRPSKIRMQGWDQVHDLCRFLSCRYGMRIMPLLERASRVQQKKLARTQRLNALSGAYVLKKRRRLPESLIMIDDVTTTGATLETCAAVLKEAGVSRVYALTLFAVP